MPQKTLGSIFSSRIIQIDGTTAASLGDKGVVCASWPIAQSACRTLDQAAGLLSSQITLEARVDYCVGEIVVLAASGDEYDVSHSEPQWPKRIYISIPAPSIVADLRVVEALIHEAMHLNLTNLEQSKSLFSGTGYAFSPWRECARPVSGVFHGLYVFTCIQKFFDQLSRSELATERRDFIKRRLIQISEDLSSVPVDQLRPFLTEAGELLLADFASVN